MSAPTLEGVQQTLAEYERLAIGTGEWNGTDAPEFSNDGIHWTPAWLPFSNAQDETIAHPAIARATVYRKGVEQPIVVYVRWDEALPAVEEWRELWLRKPVALFGAFTKRAALRSAFRDVIGERTEPDETIDAPAPALTVAADRDWFADLASLPLIDPKALTDFYADAKAARAVTVALETAIRRRRAEFAAAQAAEIAPVTPRPKPAPPKVRPEDTVRKPRTRKRGA